MQISLTIRKIINTSSDKGWIQTYDFTPDGEKLEKRGKFFALIKFQKNGDDIQTVSIGREILNRLNEEYFGNLESDAFNALKESVRKVNEEFNNDGFKVEIGAGAYINNVFYVACVGYTQVLLFRNKSLVQILKSEDKVITASGYPKEGDVIIISSSLFLNAVGNEDLREHLSQNDMSVVEESINSIVHKSDETLGCILIFFNNNEELLPEDKESHIPEKEKEPGLLRKRLADLLDKIIKILPDRRIIVRSEVLVEEKEKKTRLLFIGFVFLLILGVSIFFGIKKQREKNYQDSYSNKLNEAVHFLDESKSLYSVSPERSRDLFSQSKQKADELNNAGIKDEQLEKLNQEIQKMESEILGIHKPEVNLFLDLTLLKEGFLPDMISGSSEIMFVFDKKSKTGAKVDYKNKKTDTLTFAEDASVSKITTLSDNYYVLADKGIYEIGDDGKKVIDTTWDADADFYSYAANIYLLEKNTSKIFRFSGAGDSFGEGRDWLSSDTNLNLSSEKDMVVDGSIWLLVGENKIYKLLQGVPQSFSLDGVFPELSKIDAIYTNEELEYIYLLDKGNSRILVFDKSGKYFSQYSNEKMSTIVDFVVSGSTSQSIILGTDGKLYSFTLEGGE